MIIYVLTVAKRAHHLDRFVRQMRDQTPPKGTTTVALVGNDDSDYAIKHQWFTAVLAMPSEKMIGFDKLHIRWKMALNYIRALNDDSEDILVFEDDVLLTRNFWTKFEACRKRASEMWPDHILTLYAPHRLSKQPANTPVEHINTCEWWGSQATYFPRSVIKGVRGHFDLMMRRGINDVCQDIVVGRYCQISHVPMFCANPNLVQHLGKDSSGTTPPEWAHTSPSFKR